MGEMVGVVAGSPCSLQALSRGVSNRGPSVVRNAVVGCRSWRRVGRIGDTNIRLRNNSNLGGSLRRLESLKLGAVIVAERDSYTRRVRECSASLRDGEEVLTGESSTPSEPGIWMSDVVVKKRPNYFKDRSWTSKDLTYAGYMAFMHGLCLLAPATFSWDALGVSLGLYVITGLFGITLSFHRNLSHKSFKLPKWLEYSFAYCGVQAVQGDPLEWVSSHRYHHQHCDTEKDPHSPYEGFWHSHMGWLLDDRRTQERVGARNNVGDMDKDPFYQFIQRTYPIHPIMMAVALYVMGGFPYLIWGMALRVVWVYHITWFVNSASHVWGSQKWNTGDLSRNNWWVALLAFGEGWHNNHHAFEYSARHGLEWWQLDPTWWIICALEAVGVATKVKLPKKEHMEKLAL
ncbi:palmitoyl-monogalactosyldiacylglycerol delta-7 desaturase, chloroplastic [Physcomitrium patens]|uniref:Fatty acid desaturase domain-containing protein n=1 Tax=Physcomitrium patens TaxID=3218 RepID=A0A2K1IYS3_PHYPA|nr:palmitoyl-monogalactosyldiacylglycerol delta-7 desaturase, chloroplastic-like [Physcomitrium patens]PNR34426.1 hypothetical protein PHYPA_024243 [Physcomitrium patens]|eukprot:XP_024356646.1 palmitoyl-monogalactosyldiacylglycerol delta-7 desaturase, chloroplastic-like [Physcomitrella patens]